MYVIFSYRNPGGNWYRSGLRSVSWNIPPDVIIDLLQKVILKPCVYYSGTLIHSVCNWYLHIALGILVVIGIGVALGVSVGIFLLMTLLICFKR